MAAVVGFDPFVPQIFRIANVRRELSDTVTLSLKPVSGARPAFAPGQFNMLYVFGVGEVPISMSGDRTDDDNFVHTVRDVGAVSGAIAKLKAGAAIGVRGPFGTSWPVGGAEGRDIIIVAGGLGIAPLRPAIYDFLVNRKRFGRMIILVGSRNPKGLLYRSELEEWRRRLDIDVEVTVDHADADWRGNVGVVPSLVPHVAFDSQKTMALVCGPEVMMRFTVNALREAGIADDRIYLSMERNMKCAIGLCGHCQFGPTFVCKNGPVMRYDKIGSVFAVREL